MKCARIGLLLPFGILKALGLLFLLLTAHRIIRRPALIFLVGAALFGDLLLSQEECYYQYSALRIFFPAAGLLLSAHYFRSLSPRLYILITLLAAIAPLWNLDTGIILWLSWTVTLVLRGLFRREIMAPLRHALVQVAALLAAGTAFLLYLRLASGRWPDLALFTTFQKFTVGAGYYCIPMLLPDIWILVLTTYVVGLAAVLYFYLQGKATWKTDFALMLSLLGVGLFDYFLGRSAESNIIWCDYPMILLIGFLLDQTANLVVLRRLPPITWAFLAPFILMLHYWAAMGVFIMPQSFQRSVHVAYEWTLPASTPFQANADFIKAATQPREKVYLMSRQSGLYYYLSDTLCALEIPGTGELYHRRYTNSLLAAIRGEKISRLFVDANLLEGPPIYRPEIIDEIHQAIDQYYTSAQVSSTKRITLFLPKH